MTPKNKRTNPDGFSVKLRGLDPGTLEDVRIEDFDGQNWARHGPELAKLSKAPRVD